jgi:hypothetical protein
MSFKFLERLKDAIGGSLKTSAIRALVCKIGRCFDPHDPTKILENRMVSGDQWNPISMSFFFVLEERLSVQLFHLINCGLYFAKIISSVSEVLFEDIPLFLEAGR